MKKIKQKVLKVNNNYKEIDSYIKHNSIKKVFIVCGKSHFDSQLVNHINNLIKDKNIDAIYFSDFRPNPTYESVCDGVNIFQKNRCDSIIAIGGGSAIDVAKCIKLYSKKENIHFLVVPTTAGTGSEATKFAVIYKDGIKTSVEDDSIIPDAVLFDYRVLETLPLYQKKSTMLDALSHSIESMWSINSTEESIKYSKKAIDIILHNFEQYLKNDENTFEKMFEAANLAGKAINITKTTAGHALCYKMTSLYGISHGHATMLINSELCPYMIENLNKCVDTRGEEYLKKIFKELSIIFNDNSNDYLKKILSDLDLYDISVNLEDIDNLVRSVNVERLSNNPIKLDKEDIREIYLRLFSKVKENQKNASNRIC